MKRSDIIKIVMNSNFLVLYSAAVSMFFAFISERFRVVLSINTVFQFALAILFAVYVEWRIIYKKQRIAILLSAVMIVLETVLVEMKYHIFAESQMLQRQIWYAYYIPFILVPLFILYASMYVGKENKRRRRKAIAFTSAVSSVLIILFMTNDIHQWIFVFNDNSVDWDNDYSYGFLFYIAYAWIVALFFNAFTTLLNKNKIMVGKKYSWQIPIYVGLGWIVILVDGLTDIQRAVFGTRLISSPILFCTMSISFLLTCIRLWLIPAERDYNKLNNAIAEINEQLKDESEIIRLRNELKSEQIALREKNELYDKIAESVSEQSSKILALTCDEDNLSLICFYGAYIKRLSNMELIAFDNEEMNVYELLLAVKESAKYLERAGVPIDVTGYTERNIKSEYIVEIYKCIHHIIEDNLNEICGIYLTFPKNGNEIMRVVLDGTCLEQATVDLSDKLICTTFSEDDVSYVNFAVSQKKEGEDL